MSELYNQEEDHKEDESYTWDDAHALGKKRTKTTENGEHRFSNNMGHGAACPTCSQGILEDTELELSRDEHFKKSMNTHLGNNNG
jgi:hypothetical protein